MNSETEEGKKRALFIGRFQPFHKGHLFLIKTILENYDEVIVGVGSSQYSNTKDNPFTIEERTEMITRALTGNKMEPCTIVPIEDVHDNDIWVSHVESLVPKFEAVFTHDSLSRKLFQDSGYEVRDAQLLEREKYSGTEVRLRILKGEDWVSLVPKEVAQCIQEMEGEKRIIEIMG
ncbi:MAG: nicotinamide-nucleotide adenylyltransferase [Thermoplasmata archaeon]|nr:nicotinamide-nucleotide adenylyltransferase [Thermoplasmata archaeon]